MMDELTAVQEQRPAAVSADNNAQENSGEQMLRDMDEVAVEIERTFSYDGYQVCRKEMFAHLRDPAVTIRKDSITFNTFHLPPWSRQQVFDSLFSVSNLCA